MTADTHPPAPTGPTDLALRAEEAHAAALGELTTEAFCRTCRPVGDHVLFSVTLVAPRTLASAGAPALVLTHEDGAEHRFDVVLFDQQRGQWHVDLDVLVPAAGLAGRTWRGALDVDGTLVPLRQAPSGQDGLLAVSAGLLPADTPPAELTVPPLQDVIHG